MIEALSRHEAHTPGLRVNAQNEYIGPVLLHMGRDHGIPSYPNILSICFDERNVENLSFDDLSKYGIPREGIKLLKKLYR